MSEYEILTQLGPYLITLVMGLVGGWAIVKGKLHQFRQFIDSVDDAATDNSISEDEFQRSWKHFKVLIGYEKKH